MRRLAVIPSDPMDAYVEAGVSSWLREYYNPGRIFDDVYCFSPLENQEKEEFGLKIIPTKDKELKKRIKDFHIDIVRAYGGFWACDMACHYKVKNIPVIVSVHDTNPKLFHNSIKNADVVFCVSQVVKNLVLTKFKNEQNIWILPNRVDLSVMRPAKQEEIEDLKEKYPYKYKILHVGRKTPQKNLDTLIKALKILGEEYCLIAIGKQFPVDKDYEIMAKEQNVWDRCFFVDSLGNEDLYKYYSFTDCMCTPSRYEGFGIVFIEALACESVVVTSNIAPMNEYIHHGENGLLVNDFENPKALAESIISACRHADLRIKVKSKARDSVKKFDKGLINQKEAEYYLKILEMKEKSQFKKNIWGKFHV